LIRDELLPLKNIGLRIFLICLGLVISYIIFIALISINIGFQHLNQDGFWVPILAGVFFIAVCLWVFLIFLRFIVKQMKEKDIIENI
jgi:cytochrome c biogenesis protein CcdA